MRVSHLFDDHLLSQTTEPLGFEVENTDIKSSIGPFKSFPKDRIRYPEKVVKALGQLYQEYNQAFSPLVAVNKEWETDYQYCLVGSNETPVNFVVQIDTVGLPKSLLYALNNESVDSVREVLRRRIFEIENSLAMYQLLERLFEFKGTSFFKTGFREALNDLRTRFKKPVALLAATHQKYQAMCQEEFGKTNGEPLSDSEVLELSGFDRFFGPNEFLQHLRENNGECGYLLYVRASDPKTKLKDPRTEVEHPLLGNPEIRKLIKANSLTLNIDAPGMADRCRINDTKGYMEPIGMGYRIEEIDDMFSEELNVHLRKRKGYNDFNGKSHFSSKFASYLKETGVDPSLVKSGELELRAKPLKGHYGCYGHVNGTLSDGKFRKLLRREIRRRGEYIIQPEMIVPVVRNAIDGHQYTYIDRNFFAFTNGQPKFIGGFRNFMRTDSSEAENGRLHGQKNTRWSKIIAQ